MLVLQLSVAGTAMPLDVPIALKAGGAPVRCRTPSSSAPSLRRAS